MYTKNRRIEVRATDKEKKKMEGYAVYWAVYKSGWII